jgi:chromosome segregation ATPase
MELKSHLEEIFEGINMIEEGNGKAIEGLRKAFAEAKTIELKFDDLEGTVKEMQKMVIDSMGKIQEQTNQIIHMRNEIKELRSQQSQ